MIFRPSARDTFGCHFSIFFAWVMSGWRDGVVLRQRLVHQLLLGAREFHDLLGELLDGDLCQNGELTGPAWLRTIQGDDRRALMG